MPITCHLIESLFTSCDPLQDVLLPKRVIHFINIKSIPVWGFWVLDDLRRLFKFTMVFEQGEERFNYHILAGYFVWEKFTSKKLLCYKILFKRSHMNWLEIQITYRVSSFHVPCNVIHCLVLCLSLIQFCNTLIYVLVHVYCCMYLFKILFINWHLSWGVSSA